MTYKLKKFLEHYSSDDTPDPKMMGICLELLENIKNKKLTPENKETIKLWEEALNPKKK